MLQKIDQLSFYSPVGIHQVPDMLHRSVGIFPMLPVNFIDHILNPVIRVRNIVQHAHSPGSAFFFIFEHMALHSLFCNLLHDRIVSHPCIDHALDCMLETRHRIYGLKRMVNRIKDPAFVLFKMLFQQKIHIIRNGNLLIISADIVKQRFQRVYQIDRILVRSRQCLIHIAWLLSCPRKRRICRIDIAVIFTNLFRGQIIKKIDHRDRIVRYCNILFKGPALIFRLDPAAAFQSSQKKIRLTGKIFRIPAFAFFLLLFLRKVRIRNLVLQRPHQHGRQIAAPDHQLGLKRLSQHKKRLHVQFFLRRCQNIEKAIRYTRE